jgi:hypothetical protein
MLAVAKAAAAQAGGGSPRAAEASSSSRDKVDALKRSVSQNSMRSLVAGPSFYQAPSRLSVLTRAGSGFSASFSASRPSLQVRGSTKVRADG